MPYCTGCGVRVEAGVSRCPACDAKASAARACPRCGASLAGRDSRFCIACGAPLAASPGAASLAAPSPPTATPSASRSAPPPAKPAATPGAKKPTPDPEGAVTRAREERAAVYQRLGRLLLSSCYEGKLAYERMPDELARQTKAGIETIRKGHATLASAGVCPRCLEPTLAGEPRTCTRCRLVLPPGPTAGTQ